jgi:hypothetical protein
LFLVASIESGWIPPSGGPARQLKGGERAIAFEVTPSRRAKILERAGSSRKSWDNMIRELVPLRLAHRCVEGSGSIVCLFSTPLGGDGASCPRCAVPLRGRADPVQGKGRSRSGDISDGESVSATSTNEPTAAKVLLLGEGVGGVTDPATAAAIQRDEGLSDEEAIAKLKRILGATEEEAAS